MTFASETPAIAAASFVERPSISRMFYRYPRPFGIEALNVSGLRSIAVVHTAGAFLLVAFVVAHVYLITTGRTLTSNLKAMITGDEEPA